MGRNGLALAARCSQKQPDAGDVHINGQAKGEEMGRRRPCNADSHLHYRTFMHLVRPAPAPAVALALALVPTMHPHGLEGSR